MSRKSIASSSWSVDYDEESVNFLIKLIGWGWSGKRRFPYQIPSIRMIRQAEFPDHPDQLILIRKTSISWTINRSGWPGKRLILIRKTWISWSKSTNQDDQENVSFLIKNPRSGGSGKPSFLIILIDWFWSETRQCPDQNKQINDFMPKHIYIYIYINI